MKLGQAGIVASRTLASSAACPSVELPWVAFAGGTVDTAETSRTSSFRWATGARAFDVVAIDHLGFP